MVRVDVRDWPEAFQCSQGWLPEAREHLIWEEYQIRPGIMLAVQNHPPLDKNFCFDFETLSPPIQFVYCISGNSNIRMHNEHGAALQCRIASKRCSISYLPGMRGTAYTEPDCPLRSISLCISPDAFVKLAPQPNLALQNRFERLLSNIGNDIIYIENNMPLHIEITVSQILDCDLGGEIKKVFLEYKALELFYAQLNLLEAAGEESGKITPVEREAARRAYDILLHNLIEPPSLQKLARTVGLTHTRLNKSFRALYNDTVFGVLRLQRLECAKRMLEDARKSIAEVAYDCGFANPSHLSRAFFGQYGIQPKRYQADFFARSTSLTQ